MIRIGAGIERSSFALPVFPSLARRPKVTVQMLIGALFALAIAGTEPGQDPAPAAQATPVPESPLDDYDLVSWCRGALQGHMELRELVKEELDAVSPGDPAKDAAMQKAGEDYLALYGRAMQAAEKASPTPLQSRGRSGTEAGYALWTQVRVADPRNRMWGYLMWDLPGRCEVAAKRLEERSVEQQ